MISRRLRSDPEHGFIQVVGVGGIGTGTIFALQGNHSLGRNESRMGAIVDAHDYCKLHIVEHYIAALFGTAGDSDTFGVAAVGNVGADAIGARLVREMDEVGIDTRYVRVENECATMSSIVFLYPDKSGGNITASNSACSKLSSDQIAACRELLDGAGNRGVALCLPEVPLDKRADFLQLATECGSYRVASFASAEMQSALDSGLLQNVDLLALNHDEAIEFSRGSQQGANEDQLRTACSEVATLINPSMNLVVTDGARGAYIFARGRWSSHKAISMEATSTAGAGDALLAGTIAGLAAGIPLADREDLHAGAENSIGCAIDLGLALAAFSVTSPHTIHPDATLDSLLSFTEAKGLTLSAGIAGIVLAAGDRVATL